MKLYLTCLFLSIVFCIAGIAGIVRVPEDQPTIQAGIDAALDGDTVLVADNTYFENIYFRGKAITVASYFILDADTNHINNTVINGSQPSHPDSGSVVYFMSGEDSTSVLYGFSITGGTGTLFTYPGYPSWRAGGGIFMYPIGGRISHNKIFNNTLSYDWVEGVGIDAILTGSQHLIIENNYIHSNIGGQNVTGSGYSGGGGIAVGPDGNNNIRVVIRNNKICNNILEAEGGYVRGAGIYCIGLNSGGKVFIHDNIVSDNVCQPYQESSAHVGAGIAMHDIELKLFNNRILNNRFIGSHGYGGGVRLWNAPVEIYNNIIAGNSARNGGGISMHNIPVESINFTNNTVIGNTAEYQGGGIFIGGMHPVILNTILWDNHAPTGSVFYIYQGNVTVRYSDVQGGWVGEGNINLDPLFTAGDSMFHLTDASPCVNSGIDALEINGQWHYCPSEDFEGDERPFPGTVADMGADETPFPMVGIDPQPFAGIPTVYKLEQNYPNPFNPATTIEFALPKANFVTLKIYDVTGAAIATLVSEQLPAGSYQYQWDARGLASGVYIYRMETDDFTQSRKMLLIR